MTLRFGYGLNGFSDHRVEDAIAVVAELGYDGVALTLDHSHLDPFDRNVVARTAHVARLLNRHSLDVVVETGARYLLDPRRKHEPTLVSDSGRERRIDFTQRAVRIAGDLGAPAVSLWSGILPATASPSDGWRRMVDGIQQVLPLAERLGVVLAVEPEPGMFLDRLDSVLELRQRLGSPQSLRVTLDVGHLRCNETGDPADCVRTAGDLIANVQIDDMVRDVHEHLELGTGEVDFPPMLAALDEVGFAGLVAVELARHSHAAPVVAASSLTFLQEAARVALQLEVLR